MGKVGIMTKVRTRSRRIGLLTENEQDFLKGKIKFNSKQKSKFLRSLLIRINSCADDLNLIWQRRKDDQAIRNWCTINFNDLYNIGQSIHIRNTTQLIPESLGKVKYKSAKQKGRKKRVRYYWFDRSAGPTQYIDKPLNPSMRFQGIKPESVRKLIIKAFKSNILPANENNALSVKQIKSRLKRI